LFKKHKVGEARYSKKFKAYMKLFKIDFIFESLLITPKDSIVVKQGTILGRS
jgi:hypothetical protein